MTVSIWASATRMGKLYGLTNGGRKRKDQWAAGVESSVLPMARGFQGFCDSFAQVSFKVIVRLKTKAPGPLEGSSAK